MKLRDRNALRNESTCGRRHGCCDDWRNDIRE